MTRLIIDNRAGIPDADVLHYVRAVIQGGKVSGTNKDTYCYGTTFVDGICVSADKNKTGHKFVVYRQAEMAKEGA